MGAAAVVGVAMAAAVPTVAARPAVQQSVATAAPDAPATGYVLLDAAGTLTSFGGALTMAAAPRSGAADPAVDLAITADGSGAVVLDASCRLHVRGPGAGALATLTSRVAAAIASTDRCAAVALDATGSALWVATADGRVVVAGAARHHGDLAGLPLNGPVLDLALTTNGRGYHLVAADGGVFAFGDARFHGSMGGRPLNAPVEGLVPDPDGAGYWLVARDGGVFAFDAAFRGSMGGVTLNAPVSAMVPYGSGYLLVAEDGGTFVFSDAPFLGSLADHRPAAPVVAVAAVGPGARVLGEATDRPAAPPAPTPPASPGPVGTSPTSPTTSPVGTSPTSPTTSPTTAAPRLPGEPTLTVTTAWAGLSHPWDVAVLPDGSMLVTERAGTIRLRTPAGEVRTLAAPADVAQAAVAQSGMLGLAVDPAFASNRFVYTFSASGPPAQADNRIIRWRLSADGTRLDRDRDLLTGIVYRRTGSVGFHSGGALRFGPDGLLHATVGDTYGFGDPQDPAVLSGKVLRITRDGEPRGAGLPGWHPAVLTIGHRNPQGLAFAPGDGTVLTAEHGWNGEDEVTRLRSGGNAGWDPVSGPGTYDPSVPLTDPTIPGVMAPLWRHPDSQGMAGATFLAGPQWRDWDGALAVAFLSGTKLAVVRPDAAGTGVAWVRDGLLQDRRLRLRSLVQGPDGALYVTVDAGNGGGSVLRIAPS